MGKRASQDRSHQAIDDGLKKVYQEALEEEIPDRFVTLLQRLRAADEGRETQGAEVAAASGETS